MPFAIVDTNGGQKLFLTLIILVDSDFIAIKGSTSASTYITITETNGSGTMNCCQQVRSLLKRMFTLQLD